MTATITIDKSHVKRTASHYLAAFLFTGWLHFYIWMLVLLPVMFIFSKILFSFITGLIILSALSTINRKSQPKIFYDFGGWILNKTAGYFHLKVIIENQAELEKCGPCIFASEPHDILPLSMFAFNDYLGAIKGHTCCGLVTSAAFAVPLMRHIWTWSKASSVDKKNMIDLIQDGISPVVCPGGAVEASYLGTSLNERILYLNNRLGFIKMAFQFGIPIVPVFSFGLQDSYSFLPIRIKFIQNLGRKFGVLPIFYFGVWYSIFGPAKPCNYCNVIGRLIEVPKKAEPTDVELYDIHSKYISATIELFEKYKHEYGMGNVTLKIV